VLEVTTVVPWSNPWYLEVRFKGELLATIQNAELREKNVTVPLPSGSPLVFRPASAMQGEISLAPDWFLIERDGKPLPGSSGDPKLMARIGFGVGLAFAAAFAFVAWSPPRDVAYTMLLGPLSTPLWALAAAVQIAGLVRMTPRWARAALVLFALELGASVILLGTLSKFGLVLRALPLLAAYTALGALKPAK